MSKQTDRECPFCGQPDVDKSPVVYEWIDYIIDDAGHYVRVEVVKVTEPHYECSVCGFHVPVKQVR